MIFKDISKRIPLLIIADMTSFVLAVTVSTVAVMGEIDFALTPEPFLIASLAVFPVIFYIFDLYFPYKKFKFGITLFEITLSILLGGVLLAALSYFDRDFSWGRKPFVLTLALYGGFVLGSRMAYDVIFKSRFLDKPTIIIGTGDLARSVWRAIESTVHSGMNVVGVIVEKESSLDVGQKWKKLCVLGHIQNCKQVIAQQETQLAILALDEPQDVSDARQLNDIYMTEVQVTSGVYLLERLTGTLPDQSLDSHSILSLVAQARGRPYLKFKRIFDAVSALFLLIFSAPVWFLTALGLAFEGIDKIFFVQDRIGLNGRKFRLYKFRSMTTDRQGKPLVTALGRWLRKYRIDELPQLVNVLKGDMSLVGPRPEIEYFVKRSIEKIPMYEAVFAIKPGLTGWAQVKFRYTTSIKDYHEKFRYNLYYLKHISFIMDVLIIFKTIRIVLLGLGK